MASRARRIILSSLASLALTGTLAAQAFPGDDVVAPAAANQAAPALAAGGDLILAVWQDSRTSPIFTGEQSRDDIWAARLDGQGALVDVLPFPVTMDGGIQQAPRVAWNGTHWLVVWVGQVPTQFYYTDAILAARVAPDGSVLDPEPIVVVPEITAGAFGDVASDGNDWAVFFTGWVGAQSKVYGARVAADGSLVDVAPKTIASPGGSPYTPFGVSADFADGIYLVAWSQWSTGLDNIRAQRADGALATVGGTFNVATSSDYEVGPDVASDGSAFFVVWDRYNTCCVGGASKVYGTRVTTGGAVLDGSIGMAIYDTNGYGFQGAWPSVGWDGTQWVAAWIEPVAGGTRINAARISADGVVLDPNGVEVDPVLPRQFAPVVAGLPGGGSLLAWQDGRVDVGQPFDIHAARLEASGLPVPLGSIANAAPSQVRASAAPGPQDGALVAWTSMTSGSTRVLAQRTDADGAPIGLPVEVATGAALGEVEAAWNGSVWLLAWEGPGGISARRLDAQGVLLDAAPFFVMPGFMPDVAAQGDVFLVTALVVSANPEIINVLSRRVSATTGAVIDASSVFVGTSYARAQAVTAFDGGFLVTWQEHATHDSPYSVVRVRRVSAANVPGAQVTLPSTSSYNEVPAIAASGDVALVTWQLGSTSSLAEDVVARLIGPGPVILGATITVSAAPISQRRPSVAWDGEQFVVAWEDSRDTEAYLIDERTDAYAARVTADGVVLDPAGIPLATDPEPETWTSVTALASGRALGVWSDFQPGDAFTSYRIGLAVLGETSPWSDVGFGLPGIGGVPMLEGSGTLVAGTPVQLLLSDAAPSSSAVLVIGLAQLGVPFKGGVLVPAPDVVLAGLPTDTGGALLLAGTWPAGVPSATTLWWQAWIADASGPQGLTASNALEATTP